MLTGPLFPCLSLFSVMPASLSTKQDQNLTSKLAPELLYLVISNLYSLHILKSRSVCKSWFEMLEAHPSLWRIFEFHQENDNHPNWSNFLLDLFDEKSCSSLKRVSIETKKLEAAGNVRHLLNVIGRSSESLVDISIKTYFPDQAIIKILQLACRMPNLRELVVVPVNISRCRLLNRKPADKSALRVRSTGPQILWIERLSSQEWVGFYQDTFSSVASFASASTYYPHEALSILNSFSQSLIHLKLSLCGKTGETELLEPLSLLSLQVLELSCDGLEFPSWIDCPNLHILVLERYSRWTLGGLPRSVQELWLCDGQDDVCEAWEGLEERCPRLETLRVEENSLKQASSTSALITALMRRKSEATIRKEVDGIEAVSLRKLVMPLGRFESSQLAELKKNGLEIVDVDDDHNLIEIRC